jgi:hypothetical protein
MSALCQKQTFRAAVRNVAIRSPRRPGRIFEKIQSTLMLAKVITFAHLSAALAISAPN